MLKKKWECCGKEKCMTQAYSNASLPNSNTKTNPLHHSCYDAYKLKIMIYK